MGQHIKNGISYTGGCGGIHEYSASEQVIGAWTNGKILYEKTLQFTSTSSADTYTTVSHNISNVDMIFIEEAFVTNSDYTQKMAPIGGLTGNEWFQGTVSKTAFEYQVGSDFISCQVVVVLRYTKTS